MLSDQQQFESCMNKIRSQINSLTSSKAINESFLIGNTERASLLKISNIEDRYRLEHGLEFKDLLDPRDQVLQHKFEFNLEMARDSIGADGSNFTESNLYQNILNRIKKFLAESISNVVSIAFKFMCKGELQSSEAKQFAAKNMLVNVHSIFRQTIKALEADEKIKNNVNMSELKADLALEVDNILNNILLNLADCYPQAPISGGTPRMREAINPVNRGDDPQNDFIFTSGIKIKDYLKTTKQKNHKGEMIEAIDLNENEDYTAFIMEVINSAIKVTQQNKSDSRHRTVFEIFTEFNEHLFYMVQQKDYQQILSSLEVESQLEETNRENKMKINSVCNLFDSIFESKQTKHFNFQKTKTNELNKLWESSVEGIQSMKKNTKYAMNQKIPTSVLPFQRFEINNKQFSAKHASILRILTKWAQSLEGIFEDSEKIMKERLYPFANLQNQLCDLKCGDVNGDLKLNKQLEEQYKALRKKFSIVLKNSYSFMGKMFGDQKESSFISSISRFTETRTISSKINAALTSLMLSYINMLIHHLLKAGRQIKTQKGFQDINLLVFRVSDLMRAKLQCRESSFISLLETMYLIDSKQSMQNKFKIVKVRNKLDEPANNIIINYLFMGKVQCELQLSIQDAKGKQKHYYTFSHFVYELTRGKFGPLAQCAMMISQIDPMITACKSGYYRQKTDNLSLIREKKMEKQSKLKSKQSQQKMLEESWNKKQMLEAKYQLKNAFFECSSCNSLITTQNLSKFLEKPELKICYKCILKKYNTEQYLKDNIKEPLTRISKQRLRNYRLMRSLKQEKYLLTLDQNGEMKLFVIYYIEKDFKTFMIKIDPTFIKDISEKKDINFEGFDYIDITKDIKNSVKNGSPPKVLSYLFDNVNLIPEDLLAMLDLEKKGLEDDIKILINQFLGFRGEKQIIKKIKLKVQIIRASEEEGKILDKVCRVLVLNEGKTKQDTLFKGILGISQVEVEETPLKLRYKKQKHLDITNVLKITSERVGFTHIPRWVMQCRNLRKLDLDQNSIRNINKGQLPETIQELSLKRNGLEALDISELRSLINLYVKENKLTTLDIPEYSIIEDLSIRDNPIKIIEFLPQSLKGLWVDRQAIIHFDFENLKHLKQLWVCNGLTRIEQLTNVPKDVRYQTRS